MANPTTYFGWVMPNSADLVTDLPADFNVFGQGVDTSMQFLLGGTTGQVLSKTSATNMAFTWINNDTGDITGVTAGTGISGGGTSGTVTVTNSMATAIDAKGDLVAGTGADAFSRLAVGSNNTVLTADSAEATGLKWAAAASGGSLTLLQTLTLSGASVTSSTFTATSYVNYLVMLSDIFLVNPNSDMNMRLNADTGSNYCRSNVLCADTSLSGGRSTNGTSFQLGTLGALSAVGERGYGMIQINRINDTSEVFISSQLYSTLSAGADVRYNQAGGIYNNSAAITSMTFLAPTNNFSAGTAYIYGVN